MIDDFLGSTYCTYIYIYTVYNMIIYIYINKCVCDVFYLLGGLWVIDDRTINKLGLTLGEVAKASSKSTLGDFGLSRIYLVYSLYIHCNFSLTVMMNSLILGGEWIKSNPIMRISLTPCIQVITF